MTDQDRTARTAAAVAQVIEEVGWLDARALQPTPELILNSREDQTIRYTVAVAIALEELGRLKASESLPAPERLLRRLEARAGDFHLMAGVVAAYMRTHGGGA